MKEEVTPIANRAIGCHQVTFFAVVMIFSNIGWAKVHVYFPRWRSSGRGRVLVRRWSFGTPHRFLNTKQILQCFELKYSIDKGMSFKRYFCIGAWWEDDDSEKMVEKFSGVVGYVFCETDLTISGTAVTTVDSFSCYRVHKRVKNRFMVFVLFRITSSVALRWCQSTCWPKSNHWCQGSLLEWNPSTVLRALRVGRSHIEPKKWGILFAMCFFFLSLLN